MTRSLITFVVIVVTGLLFYLFWISSNLILFQQLWSYIVAKIVGVTGISQWLVKGIVILVLIPVLWVIPNLFRSRYRKQATVIGLVYFSIFFLSMFFLSRDVNFAHSNKEALKWYALTPEGVKLYDSPGVDPVYGIKLEPVTPEVIQKLRLLQKGEFKPIDPENVQFFNPITGEAQVWFYQYSDGNYEFYDKPGFHPVTGELLKPVTKDIVEKIRFNKISIENRSLTNNTKDTQNTSPKIIKYPMNLNQTWTAYTQKEKVVNLSPGLNNDLLANIPVGSLSNKYHIPSGYKGRLYYTCPWFEIHFDNIHFNNSNTLRYYENTKRPKYIMWDFRVLQKRDCKLAIEIVKINPI